MSQQASIKRTLKLSRNNVVYGRRTRVQAGRSEFSTKQERWNPSVRRETGVSYLKRDATGHLSMDRSATRSMNLKFGAPNKSIRNVFDAKSRSKFVSSLLGKRSKTIRTLTDRKKLTSSLLYGKMKGRFSASRLKNKLLYGKLTAGKAIRGVKYGDASIRKDKSIYREDSTKRSRKSGSGGVAEATDKVYHDGIVKRNRESSKKRDSYTGGSRSTWGGYSKDGRSARPKKDTKKDAKSPVRPKKPNSGERPVRPKTTWRKNPVRPKGSIGGSPVRSKNSGKKSFPVRLKESWRSKYENLVRPKDPQKKKKGFSKAARKATTAYIGIRRSIAAKLAWKTKKSKFGGGKKPPRR